MTVKISIDIDERYHAFAERQVQDGLFPNVSSVIEAGMDQMMADERDPGQGDPLAGMKDEILRRMDLPDDQWIDMESDDLFERVRSRISERSTR